MSISYYKNQLITNLADSTKINYKAYYHNNILFGANAEPTPDTGDTPTHDYSQDYFTLKVKSSGTIQINPDEITIYHEGEWYDCSHEDEETGEWVDEQCQDEGYDESFYADVWYSTDGGNNWIGTEGNTTINVVSGDTVMVKCKLADCVVDRQDGTYGPHIRPCSFIGSTASFDVEGNIMSLIYGDDFSGETSLEYTYTYMEYDVGTGEPIETEGSMGCQLDLMFYGTNVISAENLVLPATTLSIQCYSYMFQGCISLTKAPSVLPATTLTTNCYQSMFYGCSSLTTAPSLLATTLSNQCYYGMFESTNVLPDCTNIDFTSQSVVASGGLKGLFRGTKITDNDLRNILPINSQTNNYYLPATTLANGCYQDMFRGCTSLTQAPELPATTLANFCYQFMFSGCTNLNYIKMLATDISAINCLNNWVNGVSSSGTFVKAASMTSLPSGPFGIPNGWSVQNASS